MSVKIMTASNSTSNKKKNDEYVIPINVPEEGEAGETGTWRSQRPVLTPEKCIGCYRVMECYTE